jgi:hypothetical protein
MMLWLIGLRDTPVALFLIEQQVLPQGGLRLTAMLNWAGAAGNLTAAKHMRQHGAAWPDVLDGGGGSRKPWRGEVLEWARAEGCTSPTE